MQPTITLMHKRRAVEGVNEPEGPDSKPLRILLIEDDPDVLALIRQLLTESGFAVEAAASGEQGLTLFDPQTIDLIILDAMLPGLSGWEVCQQLKSQPLRPYVPILLLTARAGLQDRVGGLEAGADDYLTKPFDIDELLAHVRALLRIRAAEVRLWQYTRELEVLNAVASAVNSSLELKETLSLALARVAAAADAVAGGIWLAEEEGAVFRLAAEVGLTPEQSAEAMQLPRSHPVVSRVLAEGEPTLLRPAGGASLDGLLPATAALVLLPLASKGIPVGLLGLGSERPDAFPPEIRRLLSTLGITIAVAADNARLYAQARHVADTDPVTGLYNHRYMQDAVENELSRAARSNRPFVIMMIDVDRFKRYNDTYGHPAGDHLLHETARLLTGACRRTDSVGRYGGDEFIILLPETNGEQAGILAERIQVAYGALAADRDHSQVGVSLSIGIAVFPVAGQSRQELIHAADAAMYRSKHRGGGRVAIASPSL